MDTRRLQHFLGHASITNTVRYTAMSPEPFKDIWHWRVRCNGVSSGVRIRQPTGGNAQAQGIDNARSLQAAGAARGDRAVLHIMAKNALLSATK